MISISAVETGTVNVVLFYEDDTSELRTESARVSRSKALDGTVVVDHRGFVDGDRTLKINATLNQDVADDLWYLFRNETLLNLACSEGFYQGAISELKEIGGKAEILFLVKSAV